MIELEKIMKLMDYWASISTWPVDPRAPDRRHNFLALRTEFYQIPKMKEDRQQRYYEENQASSQAKVASTTLSE